MLHRQADVEGDHRRCDLVWWQGRLAPDLLEGGLDLPGNQRPVAAPEARREPSKLLIARRLSQTLEPKAKKPAALLPLLHVAQALGAPAQAIPGRAGLLPGLLGHLRVLPVNAILEQLDKELVLALEVGVEGAPGEAGLCSAISATLDPRRPRRRKTRSAALRRRWRVSACFSLRVRRFGAFRRGVAVSANGVHGHDHCLGSGLPAKKKNQISKAMIASTATTMKTRSMGSMP